MSETLKTFLNKYLSYFIGGAFVFAVLTTYFYVLLVPWYEKKLDSARNESIYLQTPKTQPENVESVPDTKKPEAYEFERVKEFYVIKTTSAEWVQFTSNLLNISFDYPIESGQQVEYIFNQWPERDADPTGVSFQWSVKPMGQELGGQEIAWGSSSDLRIGRSDARIYDWKEENQNFCLLSGFDGGQQEIDVIQTFKTPINTTAILYQCPCFLFCELEEMRISQEFKVLMIRIPASETLKVQTILIRIPDSFSQEDIEKLVNSVKFAI